MSIDEWQSRPIEDALQKKLDEYEFALNNIQLKLDTARNKLANAEKVFMQLPQITITSIEDGAVLYDGNIFKYALEDIRYE